MTIGSPSHDHLVTAAGWLFHRSGITSTGVDAVVRAVADATRVAALPIDAAGASGASA